MSLLRVQVPGKLLLAGEYAILAPGALALVLAVDRYFYATLEARDESSEDASASALLGVPLDVPLVVVSAQYPGVVFAPPSLHDLQWQSAPEPLRFAAAACQWVLHYLKDSGAVEAMAGLRLRLDAQLQIETVKLGLGSSAACCVAVVSALLHYALPDTPFESLRPVIFKLAYLAHYAVQGSGSGADIAGCVYGSVISYQRPDLDRLPFEMLERMSPEHMPDWPLLGLTQIPWPQDWRLQFGWTAQAADSKTLITDFKAWQAEAPEATQDFLFQMQMAVMALQETLKAQDLPAFGRQLKAQRRLLAQLNEVMVYAPETTALQALADAAESLGGAGKFSGAGGGDCGLAWVPQAAERALKNQWQADGIIPLDLNLDTQGVRVCSATNS
jgi:phosphomevalonate kinase